MTQEYTEVVDLIKNPQKRLSPLYTEVLNDEVSASVPNKSSDSGTSPDSFRKGEVQLKYPIEIINPTYTSVSDDEIIPRTVQDESSAPGGNSGSFVEGEVQNVEDLYSVVCKKKKAKVVESETEKE